MGCLAQKIKIQSGKSVQHRLVEQIYVQRMFAEEVQHRKSAAGKELFVPAGFIRNTEEVKAGQEQEKPRQQREIIGREETVLGEAQIGGQVIAVQRLRKRSDHDAFKTERTLAAVAQQEEQGETQNGAPDRRDLLQLLFQRDQKQRAASDAGEDAKEDAAFGHQNAGDQGNDHAAAENRQSPFQMIAAHRPAEAGKQDKRPADKLLPDIAGGSGVPGDIHTE